MSKLAHIGARRIFALQRIALVTIRYHDIPSVSVPDPKAVVGLYPSVHHLEVESDKTDMPFTWGTSR